MTITNFWPDGIQAAATITVNLEGESLDHRDNPLPLWGRRSHGRYGAQLGAYNFLELFARQGVKATFFLNGWDIERYPDLMQAIASAGHEVAASGYLQEDFSQLAPEQQASVLQQTEDAFQAAFGKKPTGFRAPDRLMTTDTRTLLAERGYRYDSSYNDEDVPYLVQANGATLAEIPIHDAYHDRYYYEQHRIPRVVQSAFIDLFEGAYDEGALFTLALTPRGFEGSGRGVRARANEQVIAAIKERPNLWLATCGEIADWLLQSGKAPISK